MLSEKTLEFRIWLSRKLLSWANMLDRAGKIECDAVEGWYFRRQWKQPKPARDFVALAL